MIRSLKTVGTAGVERSTRQNFVASKLKVNFFVLLRVACLGHLIGVKKQRKFVLRGKNSFGFKKLLELVWTLVYVFQRSMKWFHAAANFAIAKQVNKIKLLYVCL